MLLLQAGKLQVWITEEEAKEIMRVPVSTTNAKDKLIWYPCRDGIYSVKSDWTVYERKRELIPFEYCQH